MTRTNFVKPMRSDSENSDFDWEGRYQANTTGWDKGAVSPVLAEWLKTATPRMGGVLVPGCGRGHDAAAVATAWPEARVQGIDLSETAIAAGNERYPLPNLEFIVGDYVTLSGQDDVSAIIEHTCFCAIPPTLRPQYAETAARRLESGGLLVAVFYLNPIETEVDPDDGPPWGSSVPELNALFGGTTFDLVRSEVPNQAFPGRERRELLRVWQRC